MDCNAQTPIASSYGLLQALYESAIDTALWNDPFGATAADLHPRYLSDTAANLKKGDGSLNVSTVMQMRKYELAKAKIAPFADYDTMQKEWKKALHLFNPGNAAYPTEVMSYVKNFEPYCLCTGLYVP